ncbi:hypothetical protein PAJ34TS1_54420 [Paenibacillus azoreducens]|uniref:Uncharacterized protein n=1 Tax=Paenibacillus azoreducens TaxID=116718 RepID=A0A920CTD4_9BACL|nr:hypothetical protein J34TS1_30470 [Paenibacillus azoreducens]
MLQIAISRFVREEINLAAFIGTIIGSTNITKFRLLDLGEIISNEAGKFVKKSCLEGVRFVRLK